MGPRDSAFFLFPSPPPPRSTSPPSKRPHPLRRHRLPRPPPPPSGHPCVDLRHAQLPPPPPLPLPPPPLLPLPPPPPLPLPPPLPSHLSRPSSTPRSPPLPFPCRSIRMPPCHGTPPGPGAAPAPAPDATLLVLPSPSATPSRSDRGGRSVEHLVPAPQGIPMTLLICGGGSGEDLAGVPPEMLPPKKRIVRYHPYEAASTIQEMASRGRAHGVPENPPVLLPVQVEARDHGDGRRNGDSDDGLRAVLLRLRISHPALVLTKRLTPSDRSRDKACLVLPDGLVRRSPLLNMLTTGERGLVFSGERGGLRVPAFDRLGRSYRMMLKRDRLTGGTYRLTGQWSLFVSRHGMRDGDTVEMLAFRPPGWQARLERCGEVGVGIALLHCGDAARERNREGDAADGLLLLSANSAPSRRLARRRRRRFADHNASATTGP